MFFVDYRLVVLMDVLLIDNWLVVLMKDVLVMFMKNILLVLNEDILVMFMDHILMDLFHYRSI